MDEVIFLFNNDLTKASEGCARLFRDFGSIFPTLRQAALIDMTFNLGVAGLAQFEKMRSCVDIRDWPGAAKEAKDSDWYKQVGSRGRRIVYILQYGKMPINEREGIT